jgi:hypothetical protein
MRARAARFVLRHYTPPILGERRHRGLARRLVAVRVSYLLTAASRRLSPAPNIEEAVYIRSRRKATSMTTPTGVNQANDPLHQNAWIRNIQPHSTAHQRQVEQFVGSLRMFHIAR